METRTNTRKAGTVSGKANPDNSKTTSKESETNVKET